MKKAFGFPEELSNKCYALLTSMTYDKPMATFEDYSILRELPMDRYLVTSGFHRFQWSKIRSLGIERHFREIHVVDATTSRLTKKSVFADIIGRHGPSTKPPNGRPMAAPMAPQWPPHGTRSAYAVI